MTDVAALKAHRRREIRARRAGSIPTPTAARAVADRVAGLIEQLGARRVATYVSYGREVPTDELNRRLAPRPLYVPAPGRTGAPAWTLLGNPQAIPDDDGARRLLARMGPKGPVATPAELGEIDVCVLPALGVDLTGVRLGQGGGWYDRALAALPRPRRIALVWDEDVSERLPAQPHDAAVDVIVTPTRICVPNRASR